MNYLTKFSKMDKLIQEAIIVDFLLHCYINNKQKIIYNNNGFEVPINYNCNMSKNNNISLLNKPVHIKNFLISNICNSYNVNDSTINNAQDFIIKYNDFFKAINNYSNYDIMMPTLIGDKLIYIDVSFRITNLAVEIKYLYPYNNVIVISMVKWLIKFLKGII